MLGSRSRLLLVVTLLVLTGCAQTPDRASGSPPPSQCNLVPPLNPAHVSFYDRAARKVAIYGGTIWTWDGQCWAEAASPGDDPGTEAAYGFVTYDTDRQRAILFGGRPETRHMWAWETGRWNFLGTSPAMLWQIAGAVGYDAARHDFVVQAMPPAFQQGPHDPRDFSTETWLWDGGNGWQQVHPATKAPLFFSPNMIFDADSQTVLAVGPADFSRTAVLDFSKSVVWSWDGTDWRLLPGSLPGGVTLVDSGDLGVLAVERGRSLALPSQPPRVFRFQGGQWTTVGRSSVGPSVVFVPAYDPVRKQLVAFGDQFRVNPSAAETFTQDTWTWTPTSGWSKHAGPQPRPSTSPSPAFTGTPSPSTTPSPSASSLTSPSATPCNTTQSPPAFAASQPSNNTLALVTLSGSNGIVVRDITNIEAPATVATPGIPAYQELSFVSAAELAAANSNGIVRMPLAGAPQTQAALICAGWYVARYSWSADGRALTYLVESPDLSPGWFDWHLVANGSDRVIGTAPRWCHCDGERGQDVLDFRVGFSRDGDYVWLVENVPINTTDLQIRRLDGSLVTEIRPAASNPVTMSVWSGSSLYFRDANGVEVWTNGTVRPFLPGVAWILPKASPAGGEITYFARGSDGLGRVYIVSTATGQVTPLPIAAGRVEPIFLSPQDIWYAGERLCTASDTCPFSPTIPTGVMYIYDLQSGTESVSKITAVYDVWPHGT